MKVTISDIAAALSISAISVSRALSGQPGVSAELREKIINKASEMGYLKNKAKDIYSILVLHQRPVVQDNSNFSYMLQGIEKALQTINANYDIEFVAKEAITNLSLPYKLAKEKKYDGIIFIGKFSNAYVDFIKAYIPNYVFYTGYSPGNECDSVWYNFNNAGYKQCKYLFDCGHKTIAFLGGSSKTFRNKEKALGITSAMEDLNLPIIDELFIYTEDEDDAAIENMTLKLFNHPAKPTAIICQWDFIAIKAIKILYKNNLRVPENISIIGSGNTEMASLYIPALTTLDLNIEYASQSAVELLVKRINTPNKPFEVIAINATIVERDSIRKID